MIGLKEDTGVPKVEISTRFIPKVARYTEELPMYSNDEYLQRRINIFVESPNQTTSPPRR